MSEKNGDQLLRTTNHRPGLLRYIRAAFVMRYPYIADEIRNFVIHLPNLHELDLDIMCRFKECGLSDIVPVLKLQTVTTLRLSGVAARESVALSFDDWEFENNTVTSLDLSFYEPTDGDQLSDKIRIFAAVFRNLRSLKLHADYQWNTHTPVLTGHTFRCLVYSFKHAFETTLREFSFGYNDDSGSFEEEEVFSHSLGAREILKASRLEKLKVDTICLQKANQTNKPRSLLLEPSCLPTSLRTLYVRHIVATGNLNPEEKNLMHSDEAQCLSQLVNLAARRLRFPNLQKLTLAIFLPPFFEEVASRVAKIQVRKAKVQLELMFIPEWDHVRFDVSRAWPEYDRARDPRDPSYDQTLIRQA
ncbi:hypothetical protein G6011_04412 [Alternaria panax]|uniref:Uncharacterized protein n=1 Tax=Alternaria panax TaxID=48097 RepID=A0AAD4NTW1_9PLEO|nr:hypothetical protein G6011_04412 [Alternaria panax]